MGLLLTSDERENSRIDVGNELLHLSPVGFKNENLDCYANSSLQLLYNSDILSFLENDYIEDDEDDWSRDMIKVCDLLKEFGGKIEIRKEKGGKECNQTKSIC